MNNTKIEDAIQATTKALKIGASVSIMKLALISDGFTPEKADIIIKWANQTIQVPLIEEVKYEGHDII